jgi:hypothetical protein
MTDIQSITRTKIALGEQFRGRHNNEEGLAKELEAAAAQHGLSCDIVEVGHPEAGFGRTIKTDEVVFVTENDPGDGSGAAIIHAL